MKFPNIEKEQLELPTYCCDRKAQDRPCENCSSRNYDNFYQDNSVNGGHITTCRQISLLILSEIERIN